MSTDAAVIISPLNFLTRAFVLTDRHGRERTSPPEHQCKDFGSG